MYGGQRKMRYSPHHGPGYYEDQRRFQGSGYSQAGYSHAGYSQQGYSQQGWDHQSYVSGGYSQNRFAPQGYGQPYARHSPSPTYGTRSPSPQWTEQQQMAKRDAGYNQAVNQSPVPSSTRQTPVSNVDTQVDNSSTIDSYEDDEYGATTYTVSEEEPAANISCTNLLFGGGKKKAGLINCNQVDPTTTEVELNLNMPRMEHLERRVDQYMSQVSPSQSNLRAAVQAFHCKAEPIHTHQFAQYARYDYETYYDEPSYIREAFQPQMMVPPTPRPPVPSQVYESALFSEGSASTEEEEQPVPPVQRYQHKRAPREIIVDNHDTVSVLSDRHLVNMGVGPSPRHQPPTRDVVKPFSPANRASPRTPSRSKGFRDYNETPPMQANVDENGLKKDSDSSSLVAMFPDENAPKKQREDKYMEREENKYVEEPVAMQRTVYRSEDNPSFDESVEVGLFTKKTNYNFVKKNNYGSNDNPSFDESVEIRVKTPNYGSKKTNYDSNDNPSFDESVEVPIVRSRKKAEILTDDDENDRIALRSPRNQMLKLRSEMTSNSNAEKPARKIISVDELMGKSSDSSDEDVLGRHYARRRDEPIRGTEKKFLEDELLSKSRSEPEDELAGMSMGMKGQAVMADSEKFHEMSSSVPSTDIDDRVTRTPSIESNIDAILEKIENEAIEETETAGEEVDYMPSTRAAASLIESMMGTLTKQPLQKIAEDEDFAPDMDTLNLDDDDDLEEIRQMKKDLYRFL